MPSDHILLPILGSRSKPGTDLTWALTLRGQALLLVQRPLAAAYCCGLLWFLAETSLVGTPTPGQGALRWNHQSVWVGWGQSLYTEQVCCHVVLLSDWEIIMSSTARSNGFGAGVGGVEILCVYYNAVQDDCPEWMKYNRIGPGLLSTHKRKENGVWPCTLHSLLLLEETSQWHLW